MEFYSDDRVQNASGADVVSFSLQFVAPISFQVQREITTTEGEIVPSGKATAIARMPYTARIERGWRLKHDGSFYDIESLRDPNGMRRDLEIIAVAVEQ